MRIAGFIFLSCLSVVAGLEWITGEHVLRGQGYMAVILCIITIGSAAGAFTLLVQEELDEHR